MDEIKLKNNVGLIRNCPTGFSWTTFFFGFFPALFRGDVKWALIMIVAAVCTWGISALVFPFIYNKRYIKSLLEKGFFAADPASESYLVGNGYIVKD